jgi:hypothetical protein
MCRPSAAGAATLLLCNYSAQTSFLQALMTQNPASKSADPFFFRSEQKESVQRNQLQGALGLDVSMKGMLVI